MPSDLTFYEIASFLGLHIRVFVVSFEAIEAVEVKLASCSVSLLDKEFCSVGRSWYLNDSHSPSVQSKDSSFSGSWQSSSPNTFNYCLF